MAKKKDANENSIPDEIEAAVEALESRKKFISNDFLRGVIVGVFGGGVVLSILAYFIPPLAGLLGIFAGSVCDPVKDELNKYKAAWACVEGGAAIQGTDISTCQKKLD